MSKRKCKCGKQPYFGNIEDEKATCCATCKTAGMVDIKNKKCICGEKLNHLSEILKMKKLLVVLLVKQLGWLI